MSLTPQPHSDASSGIDQNAQPRQLHPLRSAADFDAFFSKTDPWRIQGNKLEELRYELTHYWFRKCVMEGRKKPPKVLELGCGEGYFTRYIRDGVELWVNDISSVALSRVAAENKVFGDALELVQDRPFVSGFDCILALEMLYYLRPAERSAFLNSLESNMSVGSWLFVSIVVSSDEIYFLPREFEELMRDRRLKLIRRLPVTARWGRWTARLPLWARRFMLLHSLVTGHQYLYAFKVAQ